MIDTTMRAFMEKILRAGGFDPNTAKLKFGDGNSKLNDVITLSTPAGHSCPFAKDCRSCAIRNPRKRHDIGDIRKFIIQDGPDIEFRCFTAIDEILRPSVRLARWWNFLTLLIACKKGKPAVVKLIQDSLPKFKVNKVVRPGTSGDFFSQIYFDAWLTVARNNPDRLFYCYTKALPFVVKRINSIPDNFKIVASYGGTHDWMIEKYKLRSCKVVKSVKEARQLGLEIDHDDSLAYGSNKSYAVLLHGQQPKGSIYAEAWSKLKKIGIGGYGKHKEKLLKVK